MGRKEILLEESIIDGMSEGLDVVEQPLRSHAFLIVWVVACCIGGLVLIRGAYLNISEGSSYSLRALANAGQQLITRAPRGIIYDQFNQPLVTNVPSFSISVNLSQALKDRDALQQFLAPLSQELSFDAKKIQEDIEKTDLERQAYYLLASNASMDQIIKIKNMAIPWIVIEKNFSRHYVDGSVFAHLIGYTGFASREDVATHASLSLTDQLGKTGIEAQYDSYLRGQDGIDVLYEDAKGNALESKTLSSPQSGDVVNTTIDADLQKFFYQSLQNQLMSLGRNRGVGIAMDPATGAVRALVSIPSFDSNNITAEVFSDKNLPALNRAISGLYSPGSTIKPLVAFGALREKITTPSFQVYSPGYLDVPNPYNPSQPSRFLDWRPQGWVNLYSAIARSSNVYFYEIGGGFQNVQGLGISGLRKYWQLFALDQKTGIDLLGETSGVLPDPNEKEEKTGQPWRLGDTYNVSIGQGDLMITPIELTRYIATFAKNGTMPTPYLVDSIKDSAGNEVYKHRVDPVLIGQSDEEQGYFEEVRKGMVDAVTKEYGSAHLLDTIPVPIAGKTGSAQIANNTKVNAFCVGYAPVKDPKLVVVVLIEDAKEGSLNAVPVAYNVFQWYVDHRFNQDEGSPKKE